MLKTAILVQKKNQKTDKLEWALISKKNRKVLKWFGVKKPSDERVQKEEKRIQFFKHQSDRMEKIISLGEDISFPKEEEEDLKKELHDGCFQYTTRIKNELGKYEEGEKYNTNFGDEILITKKDRYDNIEEHPFFDHLTKEQKEQIGDNEFEVLQFKLSKRQDDLIKQAADPSNKTAESLFKIIQFLFYRIPSKNKRQYFNRVRGKVVRLSPAEIGYKKMSPSAVVGQAVSISKNLLAGLNPVFVGQVLEELVRMLIENTGLK